MYQRLDQFLDYQARVHGGLTFASEETTTLTFAQVQERVDPVAGQLAALKVPAHFLYIDALPRNPSGKVLKQQPRVDLGKNYD